MALPHWLDALPIELLAFVVDGLDRVEDVAALAQTSRRLYSTANPQLYKRAAQLGDARPLAWAAHRGLVSTLRMALAAGADPNHEYVEHLPADEWERASVAAAVAVPAGRPKEPWAMWDYKSDRRESGPDVVKGPPLESPERPVSPVPSAPPDSASDSGGDHAAAQADAGTPRSSSAATDHYSSSSQAASVSDQESVVSSSDEDQSSRRHRDATPATEPSTPPNPGPAAVTRRFSALHLAARGGHDQIIRLLLSHGARANAPSERFCACTPLRGLLNDLENPQDDAELPRWSPLHTAICHSHAETATLLLSRGASLMMEAPFRCHGSADWSGCGATALHHAAAMGLVPVIQYILSHADPCAKIDINLRDNHTLTPFYHAYAHQRWDSTVPLLLSLGADINDAVRMYIPYTAITPLGEACRLGAFDAADRLIALGADVRRGFLATASGGCLTPLHMCCMRSAQAPGERRGEKTGAGEGEGEDEERGRARMRTMEKLLARGAELDARDCFGSTPLMAAVQAQNTFALEALSLAGAEAGAEEEKDGSAAAVTAAAAGRVVSTH